MTQAETDWEARMRLAQECGSLAAQLASAKEYIAFLENKRLPSGYVYQDDYIDGLRYSLAVDDGELMAVYVSGTSQELSQYSQATVERWEEMVSAEAAERRHCAAQRHDEIREAA